MLQPMEVAVLAIALTVEVAVVLADGTALPAEAIAAQAIAAAA